ncbi:MAG: ribokinase, partial [Polaromonas sp.]|nr:ribokinase [Polaromonas sp.]
EVLELAGPGCAGSIDAAAALLMARGVRNVLVTLGPAGCRLYQPGEAPVDLAGRAMPVADTIGAGDTFTGTLAAALARGETLPAAMQSANAAAALSVTRHGAITGMPTREAVAALLA